MVVFMVKYGKLVGKYTSPMDAWLGMASMLISKSPNLWVIQVTAMHKEPLMAAW